MKVQKIIKKLNYISALFILLVGSVPVSANQAVAPIPLNTDLADYRIQVLQWGNEGESVVPNLIEASRSPEVMIRRASVLSLGKIGGNLAVDTLREICKTDQDELVRRSAAQAASQYLQGEALVDFWEEVLRDSGVWVRVAAVEGLASITPRTARVLSILQQVQQDTSEQVVQSVSRFLWPYHAEVVSTRLRPEHQDHQLTLIKKIDLPLEGWAFRTDPMRNGHLLGWQHREFIPAPPDWAPIEIGKTWQESGYSYEGVAWYRLSLILPEEIPQYRGADLVFEAVDQSAWIWVNGTFLGAHDLGGAGWNLPFVADIGDSLDWGGKNEIVVRVLKPSGGHAGIWKPIHIELLK